jgi:hypothetical protein
MMALWLRPPGGLDALRMEEMEDPDDRGPGEIRVRLPVTLRAKLLFTVSPAPAGPCRCWSA